jgi:hypothetical protein
LQEFDELLLLRRGGQTIFFGELGQGAANLVSYFEAFPGVPAMEKGCEWDVQQREGGGGGREGWLSPREGAEPLWGHAVLAIGCRELLGWWINLERLVANCHPYTSLV